MIRRWVSVDSHSEKCSSSHAVADLGFIKGLDGVGGKAGVVGA